VEPKTRAAVYARVSTAAQDPEPQLAAVRRYVDASDWELAGEYFDHASGAEDTRPQLSRLMTDAFEHRFGAVVVWKFDRFGRSVSHLIRSLEEFQRLHIQFVSVQEKLDTATPMGKAVFTFLGALAEFERQMIRERVLIGQAAARAAGKHLGRVATKFNEEKIRKDYELLGSLRKTALIHGCSKDTILAIVTGQRNGRAVR
jgi:DNA invertase Pin-like site-specific DNA recombinase